MSKATAFLKKKYRKNLFFIFVLFLVLFALYLVRLDRQIRTKFEAHRWNLPSRVYSDSLYLYPGQKILSGDIEKKMERLHYKNSASAQNPGEFSRKGMTLEVYLHDFDYPSESFRGFPLTLEFSKNQLSRILKKDGKELTTLKLEPELIASIFDDRMEDRTLIFLDKVPQSLIDAVIVIEDGRFYAHRGVDPKSIFRAFLTDLFHLKLAQGGSTITQQLVKNFFLTSEKSFVRKINEMLMAILLEWHYSKKEILEAYLNEIYFGQNGAVSITGVEEASKFYFSKGVSQLSIAEAAMLGGMIRSPGAYSPLKNKGRALDRRNFVLNSMKEKGKISAGEFREARKEEFILPQPKLKHTQAPFFISFVQEQLKKDYPKNILQAEGLRIFTTLDMRAQEIAEEAVKEKLEKLEEEKPKLKKFKKSGKILEAALISLQPQTGAIRALVGGRDYEKSQFSRVTEARRQPGSAFKPFVYLAALQSRTSKEDGPITWATAIEDASFTVRLADKDWVPQNYDKKEHGLVTLQEALEKSHNLATTKLAMEIGLEKVVNTAVTAGIESPMEPYPSLALGAFEVTPLELARAYTIFPNQGTRTEPTSILSIVTPQGEVLEKRGFKMKRVISEELAYLMNTGLRGVLDRGTATSARSQGFTGLAAGKTGTTSDYRDSWFVGYTPDLLSIAWIGYDDGTATGLSGSTGALPLWTEFMKRMNPQGASAEDFQANENIILVKISKSGRLHRPKCGEIYVEEAFIKGTEPREYCDP